MDLFDGRHNYTKPPPVKHQSAMCSIYDMLQSRRLAPRSVHRRALAGQPSSCTALYVKADDRSYTRKSPEQQQKKRSRNALSREVSVRRAEALADIDAHTRSTASVLAPHKVIRREGVSVNAQNRFSLKLSPPPRREHTHARSPSFDEWYVRAGRACAQTDSAASCSSTCLPRGCTLGEMVKEHGPQVCTY
eukprot:1599477-Pleurochrysis_carterae.AAC.1